MNKRAYCLMSVLMAVSFALLCGLAISGEALRNVLILRLKALEVRAFYLSQSGLEHGKTIAAKDNSWFTDSAPVDENKNRLLTVSCGNIYTFGHGGYKIIRENGKKRMYSVGFIGTDILKSPSYSFQKIDFELPFKTLKWEEF